MLALVLSAASLAMLDRSGGHSLPNALLIIITAAVVLSALCEAEDAAAQHADCPKVGNVRVYLPADANYQVRREGAFTVISQISAQLEFKFEGGTARAPLAQKPAKGCKITAKGFR